MYGKKTEVKKPSENDHALKKIALDPVEQLQF